MGLSKSTRIQILLGIDTAFFLLEIVIGYAVHSLALVADSFHMLNDVISLCVGLWAVKVAGRTTRSKMYTYGWQRAETLGALINGVFLVALCLSIFLEAIQRFIEPEEVSHPQLVLIVGCFGLASNIIGLFLFHDHGHGHGHGHSHGGHSHAISADVEAGASHDHSDGEDRTVVDEHGTVADVLHQSRVKESQPTKPLPIGRYGATANGHHETESSDTIAPCSTHTSRSTHASRCKHRHSTSRTGGYSGLEDIKVHPASFRSDIVRAGRINDEHSGEDTDTDTEPEQTMGRDGHDPSESSNLIQRSPPQDGLPKHHRHSPAHSLHDGHKHTPQKKEGKKAGGHSHSDLNMRGVFLHVMGDALGNIGVIGTAAFIWLTPFKWRFYSDPAVSLLITLIILLSAIPLCKAASRILLQAVPAGISVDDIKDDVNQLPGIVSCHHLHVWQLSDTKLVASLHVQLGFDFKGEGSARYMSLARDVQSCLHAYGIHSSTIQPEFGLDATAGWGEDGCNEPRQPSKTGGNAASADKDSDACLLECGNECGTRSQCCEPVRSEDDGDGHGHDHDHGHEH